MLLFLLAITSQTWFTITSELSHPVSPPNRALQWPSQLPLQPRNSPCPYHRQPPAQPLMLLTPSQQLQVLHSALPPPASTVGGTAQPSGAGWGICPGRGLCVQLMERFIHTQGFHETEHTHGRPVWVSGKTGKRKTKQQLLPTPHWATLPTKNSYSSCHPTPLLFTSSTWGFDP